MEVEIWSDIACPWCYIGKRRFEAALAGFEQRADVRVTWRSFELDTEAPAERLGDRAEHLARKYGSSVEQARAMQDQMTEVAAGEGLGFRFDSARSGNTFDAHRVVHLAAARGVQDAVKERLLRGYLCEGELISDHATLRRLASEAGLMAADVDEVLATQLYADAVRDDERKAGELGITGIPFFVVDRRLGASGAQSPEVLGDLLREGWSARSPLALVPDGDSCGVNGC